MSTPDSIRYSSMVRISKLEADQDPKWVDHLVKRQLHERMAQHIVGTRGETRLADEFYEVRLELYVATPEEFWAIVNKEALKLAQRMKV
jgi:hypothetical protein